ncbi:MAG: AAA family ATPase [Gammaproteobacteria bacterium]
MLLSDVKLGHAGVSSRQRTANGPVQVIAVTSSAAGTGKTNIAVNISLALVSMGYRILLLDADFGKACASILLGVESTYTLYDVLDGNQSLEDILVHGPDGLMTIAAASGNQQLAELGSDECAGLVRVFSDLKSPVDILIIDMSGGISASMNSFCRAASEVLVLVSGDPDSLQECAEQIRKMFSGYGISRFRILVNRVTSAQQGDEIFRALLEQFLHEHDIAITYAGYIPEDEYLRKSAADAQAVVAAYPHSRSAMALMNLARRIKGWPLPECAGGHLEFFVERLIQKENVESEVTS